jgi:hypothetical protein
MRCLGIPVLALAGLAALLAGPAGARRKRSAPPGIKEAYYEYADFKRSNVFSGDGLH